MAKPKSEKWWAAIRARGLSEKFLASVRTPEYRAQAGARHLKHGHAPAHGPKSPTYQSWLSMRSRVTNPNRREWAWYGARGITCDPRWAEFVNFLADMGERPEGTSLDRIDPDGNYELSNCRWATWDTQVAHRRGGNKFKRSVTEAPLRPPLGPCLDQSCDRLAKQGRRGLCGPHYERQYRAVHPRAQ